jgi:hypothetical protein
MEAERNKFHREIISYSHSSCFIVIFSGKSNDFLSRKKRCGMEKGEVQHKYPWTYTFSLTSLRLKETRVQPIFIAHHYSSQLYNTSFSLPYLQRQSRTMHSETHHQGETLNSSDDGLRIQERPTCGRKARTYLQSSLSHLRHLWYPSPQSGSLPHACPNPKSVCPSVESSRSTERAPIFRTACERTFLFW